MQCQYCSSPAKKMIVWLKDADDNPIRERHPWCGSRNCIEAHRGGDFFNPVLDPDRDFAVEDSIRSLPNPDKLMEWIDCVTGALAEIDSKLHTIEGLGAYERDEIGKAIDRVTRSKEALDQDI